MVVFRLHFKYSPGFAPGLGLGPLGGREGAYSAPDSQLRLLRIAALATGSWNYTHLIYWVTKLNHTLFGVTKKICYFQIPSGPGWGILYDCSLGRWKVVRELSMYVRLQTARDMQVPVTCKCLWHASARDMQAGVRCEGRSDASGHFFSSLF